MQKPLFTKKVYCVTANSIERAPDSTINNLVFIFFRNLQRKLTLSQVEISDCKLRSERLEKDSEIYRNQRDRVLEARKESILERDKVIAEKEIIQMQYNELQSKYEKFNQERETLFQDYDATKKRYELTMQELGEVKKKINEKEMEAEDLNRLLIEAEEKVKKHNI